MPRDSVRISASASWDCCSASSSSALAPHRVVVEPPLGGGDVHAEPDQALLRTVVQVPLQPAQRVHLGLAGGGPALGQLAHLLAQGGGLVDEQGRSAMAAVQPDQAVQHERRGEQQNARPSDGVERDVGEPPGEAEQRGQPVVSSSGS